MQKTKEEKGRLLKPNSGQVEIKLTIQFKKQFIQTFKQLLGNDVKLT